MANLTDPGYYHNRELSWLTFNARVLEEALDETNPLLERLKFLAITASNMDEFFMIRVSGIMDQVIAGVSGRDPSGMTPSEQLAAIRRRVRLFTDAQYACLNGSLTPALEREGFAFYGAREVPEENRAFVEDYFQGTVFPILTPMAVDQGRPFPLLNNKSLNVVVELRKEELRKEEAADQEENLFALVQVPTVIPRLLLLPPGPEGKTEFVFLESLVKERVARLFQGHSVVSAWLFRITRNFDFELDEDDVEDLLFEIEKSVKLRKWGEPVRVEVERGMGRAARRFLKAQLMLEEGDIYEAAGPLDLSVWMGLAAIRGFDRLRNPPLPPQPCPDFSGGDIFGVIRKKDVLVHHPYDSFDCVVDFVRQAAADPRVLAIKQTLYRVSGDSPVVAALIEAAENGKSVTVMVELKARFDEENNINWARMLERSGCHVVYGLAGLKTHCKICLVVRRDDDGIRRYVHMGTGNYNDSTARLYTDLGFFTSTESYGQDCSALFNVLTGYSENTGWRKLSVAPMNLRRAFLDLIGAEAANAANGKPAAITAKMNALVDEEIIRALYRASMAGVKIRLIVRGICCLKTGVAGVSDNISVVSVVDRFLEHSRVFCFENAGEPIILLSSADWMPRNFDRRVETAFPVEAPALKARIMEILELILSDTVKLRVARPDGSYAKPEGGGAARVHAQLELHRRAAGVHLK